MPKKPRRLPGAGAAQRPRAERRQEERALAKLRSARERLYELELGGSAQRPLAITSAAVVESHAESVPCPSCGGRQQVVEHIAVTVAGARLREARLMCRQCGTRRSFWFRLADSSPN